MIGTITLNQLQVLNYVVGQKVTILTSAVVKLHHANKQDKKWIYTDLCGGLCLIMNRELGGVAMFRMYDLNCFELIFETELYYDFDKYYCELNDFFHCFEVPGNFLIGFSFADSDEAAKFKSDISRYTPKSDIMQLEDKLKKRDANISAKKIITSKVILFIIHFIH